MEMDDGMVMDDDMSGGMTMTFLPWETYKTSILFTTWKVQTKWEFALSWFAVAIFAIMYHAFRFLIYTLEEHMYRPYTESDTTNNNGRGHPTVVSTAADQQPYHQLGDKGGGRGGVGGGEGDVEPNNASNNTTTSQREMNSRTLEAISPTQYMMLRILHAVLSGVNYGVALLLMLVAMTFNPSLFVALMFGYAVGDFVFFSWTRPSSVAQDCH